MTNRVDPVTHARPAGRGAPPGRGCPRRADSARLAGPGLIVRPSGGRGLPRWGVLLPVSEIIPVASVVEAKDEAEVGSYFVANYPPFSTWTADAVEREATRALDASPADGVPLGMYLHIPFCRKRCHFCYFRVYTDKNASEIADYLDVLVREWELYTRRRAIEGRPLRFVYFGGGTPSYLSSHQLEGLVDRLSAITSWKDAEEITFECEPGTLSDTKLATIRRLGVTRLSLGVEHFDDHILE